MVALPCYAPGSGPHIISDSDIHTLNNYLTVPRASQDVTVTDGILTESNLIERDTRKVITDYQTFNPRLDSAVASSYRIMSGGASLM